MARVLLNTGFHGLYTERPQPFISSRLLVYLLFHLRIPASIILVAVFRMQQIYVFLILTVNDFKKKCIFEGFIQKTKYENFTLMKRLSLILIICLFAAPVFAGDFATRIDRLMNLYHTHNNFEGTVLVARDGEVLFTEGYGYANREHRVPNGPDIKYRIASNAKQFTAMLVLQKVAEGKMSLDSSIRAYIPDYPAPQGDRITLHHLLTHTSGMPHYAGIPDFFPRFGRQAFAHRDFVELFWDLELMTDPGEEYSYSSFGYYLLGYILEVVSGMDFDELLATRILQPLDMHNTGIEDHRQVLQGRAQGYDMVLDHFFRAYFRDLSTALATGDMYATPYDMVKWDAALRDYRLLDKEYQDLMFEPYKNGYGYGWNIGYRSLGEHDSLYYHQHTGGTNGFTTIGTRLPEDGYFILVYCNTRPGEIRPVMDDIISILYDREVDFRPSVTIAAARILEEEGLHQALDFVRDLATEKEDEERVTEQVLSHLGRQLMVLERRKEAKEFMLLNTELFPESARAYMMLGDAWHALGEREKAIHSYAKALLLDPSHEGALWRIRRDDL